MGRPQGRNKFLARRIVAKSRRGDLFDAQRVARRKNWAVATEGIGATRTEKTAGSGAIGGSARRSEKVQRLCEFFSFRDVAKIFFSRKGAQARKYRWEGGVKLDFGPRTEIHGESNGFQSAEIFCKIFSSENSGRHRARCC